MVTQMPAQPWADLPKVLELAKRSNAVIKVSGACTLSQEPYPFPDIWDPLGRVFDAWGFDRCLWGSDWTRAFAVCKYEQAVKPFLQTNRLSSSERPDVLIVGAGPTGLMAAALLLRSGVSVRIVDKSPTAAKESRRPCRHHLRRRAGPSLRD